MSVVYHMLGTFSSGRTIGSQAPLANREKSVHAATVVSIQRTSTTFSASHSAGVGAGVWAVLTAGWRAA